MWKNHLQNGGRHKKRFQYCTDSTSEQILYLRASKVIRKNLVDSSLQDNVLVPDNFFGFIHHVGCYVNMHSIIASGLIAGGKKNSGRDRQKVLFTAVEPMNTHCFELKEFDLAEPRLAAYKLSWKIHQDAMYWVDIGRAQRMGLKFWILKQARSEPVTRNSVTDVDLETSGGYNLLSVESVSFLERVNARLRVMRNRPPKDKMDDIDKHSLSWRICMSSTLSAAVFLGRDHSENLQSNRSTDEKPTVKKLFEVTQKLIREQRLEISGVSEISWETSLWERLSLVNDEEVVNFSKAKVYVSSGSVLCLGRIRQFPESNEE